MKYKIITKIYFFKQQWWTLIPTIELGFWKGYIDIEVTWIKWFAGIGIWYRKK